MSQPHIRMYCTSFCPYCVRANQLLESKGVEFEKINAIGDVWQQMEAESHQSTVPQIFVGDLHLGGYDDIAALERAGKLDDILSGDVVTL